MRFHVVSLPHTQTSKRHNACAYTMKVYNFCKMMTNAGHTVFHYGAEGSDPPCSDHIQIISAAEQQKYFGHNDWSKEMYDIEWDEKLPYWRICNNRAAAEIISRLEKRDFVCVIGGSCQKPLADLVGSDKSITVEFGVGYRGVFCDKRVFESYAHMAHVYGSERQGGDGHFYDAVIPNYFDPSDFPFNPVKKDHFLYLGRMIQRKGIQIAVEATRKIGAKLLIAGQGIKEIKENMIVCTDGQIYRGEHLEYVGFANVSKRAELMGEAKAVFVPTLYLEPFGGVNVEAQMCGTPVITTDWGAFPETVEHGATGYRCRTLEQFCWAAQHCDKFDYQYIRDRALKNWSLERVSKMYEEYFQMLLDLWHLGWYEDRNDRTQLDWLRKW